MSFGHNPLHNYYYYYYYMITIRSITITLILFYVWEGTLNLWVIIPKTCTFIMLAFIHFKTEFHICCVDKFMTYSNTQFYMPS